MHENFPTHIYYEVKRLFPENTVQVMTSPSILSSEPGAVDPVAEFDPAVRLIHTPTGIEITCEDFPSQTENYIAAAIRLRIACDKRDA
jgi:hypothetical protein